MPILAVLHTLIFSLALASEIPPTCLHAGMEVCKSAEKVSTLQACCLDVQKCVFDSRQPNEHFSHPRYRVFVRCSTPQGIRSRFNDVRSWELQRKAHVETSRNNVAFLSRKYPRLVRPRHAFPIEPLLVLVHTLGQQIPHWHRAFHVRVPFPSTCFTPQSSPRFLRFVCSTTSWSKGSAFPIEPVSVSVCIGDRIPFCFGIGPRLRHAIPTRMEPTFRALPERMPALVESETDQKARVGEEKAPIQGAPSRDDVGGWGARGRRAFPSGSHRGVFRRRRRWADARTREWT